MHKYHSNPDKSRVNCYPVVGRKREGESKTGEGKEEGGHTFEIL